MVKNCQQCNKEFCPRIDLLKLGYGNFCSRKCNGISQRKRTFVNCQKCNRGFEAKDWSIRKGLSRFCSPDCSLYGSKRRVGKKHSEKTILEMRKSRKEKFCIVCQKEFGLSLKPFLAKKSKFCSQSCATKFNWTGRKHKKESIKKIVENNKMRGKLGELHHNYIKDRSKLAKRQIRNDYSYQDWRNQVIRRDGGTCKLKNENCNGYYEVHHILSWRDYPNERYNINNGITLCLAHHPRKRAEEKRLAPTFQELVSVSNVRKFA